MQYPHPHLPQYSESNWRKYELIISDYLKAWPEILQWSLAESPSTCRQRLPSAVKSFLANKFPSDFVDPHELSEKWPATKMFQVDLEHMAIGPAAKINELRDQHTRGPLQHKKTHTATIATQNELLSWLYLAQHEHLQNLGIQQVIITNLPAELHSKIPECQRQFTNCVLELKDGNLLII